MQMTYTEQAQIDLAHALLTAMKKRGWGIQELVESADVTRNEVETILRGEFDFGVVGLIQDELDEQIIVIKKP